VRAERSLTSRHAFAYSIAIAHLLHATISDLSHARLNMIIVFLIYETTRHCHTTKSTCLQSCHILEFSGLPEFYQSTAICVQYVMPCRICYCDRSTAARAVRAEILILRSILSLRAAQCLTIPSFWCSFTDFAGITLLFNVSLGTSYNFMRTTELKSFHAAFPTDLHLHLSPQIPELKTFVYPTYKTKRPLELARDDFLNWWELVRLIVPDIQA
jgi:hypothetical protein